MKRSTMKNSLFFKLLTLLLCALLAACVCACGGGGESSSSWKESSTESGHSSDRSDSSDSSSEPSVDTEQKQLEDALYAALSDGLQKPALLEGSLEGEVTQGEQRHTLSLSEISACAELADPRLTLYGNGDVRANLAGISFARAGEFVFRLNGDTGAHEAWLYDDAVEKLRADEDVEFYLLKNLANPLTAFTNALFQAQELADARGITLGGILQLLSSSGVTLRAEIESTETGYTLTAVNGEYGETVNGLFAEIEQNKEKMLGDVFSEKGLDALALYNALTSLLSGQFTVGDSITMVENYLQKEGYAFSVEEVFAFILGHGALEAWKTRVLDDVIAEQFAGQSYQAFVHSTREKLEGILSKSLSQLMTEYSIPQEMLTMNFSKLSVCLSAEFDGERKLLNVGVALDTEFTYGETSGKLKTDVVLQEFGKEVSAPEENEYFFEPTYKFLEKQGDFLTDETIVYTFDKGSTSYMVPSNEVKITYSGSFKDGETSEELRGKAFNVRAEDIQSILTAGEDTLTLRVEEIKDLIAEDIRAYMIENDVANAAVYESASTQFFKERFTYEGARGITMYVSFAYGELVLSEKVTFNLRDSVQ